MHIRGPEGRRLHRNGALAPGLHLRRRYVRGSARDIKEAIAAWIEVSREYGDEVPPGDVAVELVAVEV